MKPLTSSLYLLLLGGHGKGNRLIYIAKDTNLEESKTKEIKINHKEHPLKTPQKDKMISILLSHSLFPTSSPNVPAYLYIYTDFFIS